jgi:hypothetical protein
MPHPETLFGLFALAQMTRLSCPIMTCLEVAKALVHPEDEGIVDDYSKSIMTSGKPDLAGAVRALGSPEAHLLADTIALGEQRDDVASGLVEGLCLVLLSRKIKTGQLVDDDIVFWKWLTRDFNQDTFRTTHDVENWSAAALWRSASAAADSAGAPVEMTATWWLALLPGGDGAGIDHRVFTMLLSTHADGFATAEEVQAAAADLVRFKQHPQLR